MVQNESWNIVRPALFPPSRGHQDHHGHQGQSLSMCIQFSKTSYIGRKSQTPKKWLLPRTSSRPLPLKELLLELRKKIYIQSAWPTLFNPPISQCFVIAWLAYFGLFYIYVCGPAHWIEMKSSRIDFNGEHLDRFKWGPIEGIWMKTSWMGELILKKPLKIWFRSSFSIQDDPDFLWWQWKISLFLIKLTTHIHPFKNILMRKYVNGDEEKITGETLEVRSDKRKPREERKEIEEEKRNRRNRKKQKKQKK